MIFLQTLSISYPPPQVADENLSPEVLAFIEQWTRYDEIDPYGSRRTYNLVEPDTSYFIDLAETETDHIVHLDRLNDIRYINKFLEATNQKLPIGGRFIGCVESSKQRENRLQFNRIRYLIDYFVHRVWPKLPNFKKWYFRWTKGKNRVISEMETFGRLYSCGFKVLDSKQIDGILYFVAEKTGNPKYDTSPTYGPLITLKRVGKGGAFMKVYKIRTMYPYSEYVQEYIFERNGLGDGAKFKDDPRINRLGRIMRRYWMDELPMIYHLIKGDVKLFGVRPISRHYFSLYPKDFQEFRKKFKPGLIPPVYVEIPKSVDDTVAIERRYLEAYEKKPILTDLKYMSRFIYNICVKMVRSR